MSEATEDRSSKDAEASALDDLTRRQENLRRTSRATIGVTGAEDVESLRQGMRKFNVSWYPLTAIGLLAVVDEFQGYAFAVLGPDIGRSIGISRTALGMLIALRLLTEMIGALPMAAYVQRKPRRAAIAIITGFLWAIATVFTGFVINVWGMLFVLVLGGLASGSVRAIHIPLLMDLYPPAMRVRTQSSHRIAVKIGQIVGPLTVAFVTAVLGLTWRGVFPVLGFIAVLAAVVALWLRDPGFGRWDADKIRQQVREEFGGSPDELSQEEVSLGFFEIVRRIMLVPTVRRLLFAFTVFGMWVVPLQTFIFFFLDEQWNMGPAARGVFFAIAAPYGIAGLLIFARRGERMFQKNPELLIDFMVKVAMVMVVSLALAVLSPYRVPLFIMFGITTAAGATVFPLLYMVIMSIVHPSMRAHAGALAGIAMTGVGGLGGLLLLGGIDRRFGIAAAVASLTLPGVIAVFVLRRARRSINADIDRLIDDIVADEEVKTLRAQGVRLPMLACRHVDFAYDGIQVLYDVNFAVEDGEMVTLLGTNGAGKSTLLRVISGLGLPYSGRVHYRGADITFVDPERRLGLGITQIPGGRAIFSSLSVVENLRVYGFAHGRDRGAVDRGIDETFEAFPALALRRNQPAVTLSGGEQQMLALGKAFILQPRLLLIDELSLGLAPRIVGELLDMVRKINRTGTAVVLVEQSVNIALSLVEHAYFMEKGEIRFDGAASELLERPDLLRSVFLEGAAKGLPGAGSAEVAEKGGMNADSMGPPGTAGPLEQGPPDAR